MRALRLHNRFLKAVSIKTARLHETGPPQRRESVKRTLRRCSNVLQEHHSGRLKAKGIEIGVAELEISL